MGLVVGIRSIDAPSTTRWASAPEPLPARESPRATQPGYPSQDSLDIVGSMEGADIMAMAFLTMMEAGRSAREDTKALMDQVKAINASKGRDRSIETSSAKLPDD
jgi:hypothetical protein